MLCLEVHQLLADIQVVLKCFPNPAIAMHISQLFTKTMVVGAEHLMQKLISTSQPIGDRYVRHFFVNTLSVVSAKLRGLYD